MTGLRLDVIASLSSNEAAAAFVKFARGQRCTRDEARLAMVLAIIADVPEADLPTLQNNIEMLIASRAEGQRRALKLIRKTN